MVIEWVVLLGGACLARVVARRLTGRVVNASGRAPPAVERALGAPPAGTTPPVAGADPARSFAPFPCALGDVVMRRAERDEAWLESALVFLGPAPVAVLFVAPEVGGDRAVFASAGQEGLVWLDPCDRNVSVVLGEPPSTIEHAGSRFTRIRRVPVHVETWGQAAPRLGDRAILAEYEGTGAERLVVVVAPPLAYAWRGVALLAADVDVLPGNRTR